MKKDTNEIKQAQINLRTLERRDFKKLTELYKGIYGKDSGITNEMLNGQISRFPQGQFIIEAGEQIIGHCATFLIKEEVAFKDHTYDEITGGGFASRHDEDGDYLYGMEIGVSKEYRGLRIGQRLYEARKKLCIELGLKGIVFGGRMPNYAKKQKQVKTPEEYINQVLNKKIKDPVIGFQTKNGFSFVRILKNYLPLDLESLGYAAFMLWENPHYSEESTKEHRHIHNKKDSVRVCSVQFQVREVKSFEEFASQVEYFVDVASDYRSDFVLFPEFLTIPLISIDGNKVSTTENIERLTLLTDKYVNFFQDLAVSYNINIIGGTHPTKNKKGEIQNMAYVFLRDGSVHTQAKIHITPSEKYWRNIHGGDTLSTIETDCGTIGVLVCYDAEFPELSRHLTDQGMKILFVPFCTDEKQGYNRVRYCSQARAVENQIYVVMSGTVGNLPNVDNMDVNYAESCIMTPCDFPFARDGIAATSIPNTEMVIMSDLNFNSLSASRKSGTVQNLKDRRLDLYRVAWKKK
ncbi:MAG: carbon-nitrogen hydrolase [Alphaproteobacteria bacterium CG11_big_fil_rev_8_21_14_0_20_44_7]|nr:MAG: carbon-nitrogen hydrolase [Alphaproteobacteria bacterium CG11_big_fil_rev_8_21_14_0_20_44_7]